jgi:hypothetical protein
MTQQEPDTRRADFPTGYFGCCGRSKARGHWEHCHRIIATLKETTNADR